MRKNLWPFTFAKDFALRNYLFGAVKLTKSDAEFDKYKYSGYGIGFDARGSFPLLNGSGFGKNVITFIADMSPSMHIDNNQKDTLILGKGLINGLNDTTLNAEKEYAVNFTEQQNNIWLSLYYNRVNSYLFVNNVEVYKFKATYSEINAAPLCLGNASKDFSAGDIMKKTGLFEYGCEFSDYCDSIDVYDIPHIHKHFMRKRDIK